MEASLDGEELGTYVEEGEADLMAVHFMHVEVTPIGVAIA